MIIVRLTGGLGNQMFQYAAARSLAEKHSTILKLDIHEFETYKLHRYSLHAFHIQEYIATRNEIKQLISYRKLELLKNKVNRKLKQLSSPMQIRSRLYSESRAEFDSHLLSASDGTYIEGYWQSEKYFFEISDVLHREFSIKYPQDFKSAEISEIIDETQSISLHVRRNDYIKNSKTNQKHGACSLDYYQDCVRKVVQKVSNPHFFVFSDDSLWAKSNLEIDYPTIFVDHNNATRNYEDLRLMSQCKHNIVANSTFSWWGAWLNQNPKKIVYAPQKWFNDPSRNAKDLIPDDWILI